MTTDVFKCSNWICYYFDFTCYQALFVGRLTHMLKTFVRIHFHFVEIKCCMNTVWKSKRPLMSNQGIALNDSYKCKQSRTGIDYRWECATDVLIYRILVTISVCHCLLIASIFKLFVLVFNIFDRMELHASDRLLFYHWGMRIIFFLLSFLST
jgi:hypothetical protein